jgi:hypothetical protein
LFLRAPPFRVTDKLPARRTGLGRTVQCASFVAIVRLDAERSRDDGSLEPAGAVN